MRDDSAIYCEGLSKHYEEIKAVDELSLAVKKGEIYGFLGPNGAGKTTALRMFCTLLRPTSGFCSVAGFDVNQYSQQVRLRIGVALQDTSLDEVLTGMELLRLQGRYFGLKQSEIKQRIEELSQLIDMSAVNRRVGTYSGGMKRRLDLAASLIHNPDVLFLDEPTTGLDPISRANVWEEIRNLNQEKGMTIFLTTQYLEEADILTDRIGILTEGQIRVEGTPSELKHQIGADVISIKLEAEAGSEWENLQSSLCNISGVKNVEVRGDEVLIHTSGGAEALSPVAIALNQAEIRVVQISMNEPTLDDVFLEVTGERLKVDAPGDTEENESSGS